jgi:hypothetical protein
MILLKNYRYIFIFFVVDKLLYFFLKKKKISEDDVENWVILGIMSKVVDAEID